jgi:hypothetical protein
MYARNSVDSEIPLRGYLLSVGGALLLLLLAAGWVLPAPLPNLLIETQSVLPPIRIHSDLKGPEAVMIDTSQHVPMAANETIAATSQQLDFDIADAARQRDSSEPTDDSQSSRPATSMTSHVRESPARPDLAVAVQAHPSRSQAELPSEPRRNFAEKRRGKRHRSPRRPSFDAPFADAIPEGGSQPGRYTFIGVERTRSTTRF